MDLVVEPAAGIGQVAGALRRAGEVAPFAGLRPLVGHLPHDPLNGFVTAAQIGRQEAAVLLRQVHHDRPALEHAHRVPATWRVVIDQGRHAIVRRDSQEFRLELVAAADMAGDDPIGDFQLLQEDGHLLAVWRRPIVQVDHDRAPGFLFALKARRRRRRLNPQILKALRRKTALGHTGP
jgi:hypothetical protein